MVPGTGTRFLARVSYRHAARTAGTHSDTAIAIAIAAIAGGAGRVLSEIVHP